MKKNTTEIPKLLSVRFIPCFIRLLKTQRNLGYLYLKGKGVKKDKAEAEKWLRKAAAQGDPYAADLLKEIK